MMNCIEGLGEVTGNKMYDRMFLEEICKNVNQIHESCNGRPSRSESKLVFNTHRAHPFYKTLTAHGGIFLPPDGKLIISKTP